MFWDELLNHQNIYTTYKMSKVLSLAFSSKSHSSTGFVFVQFFCREHPARLPHGQPRGRRWRRQHKSRQPWHPARLPRGRPRGRRWRRRPMFLSVVSILKDGSTNENHITFFRCTTTWSFYAPNGGKNRLPTHSRVLIWSFCWYWDKIFFTCYWKHVKKPIIMTLWCV